MRSRSGSDVSAQVPTLFDGQLEAGQRKTPLDYSETVAATFLIVLAPRHGQDKLQDGPLGYEAAWLEEFPEVVAQEPDATAPKRR